MKNIHTSRIEKIFWILIFLFSLGISGLLSFLILVLLFLRIRLGFYSTSINLDSEIIDNFLYSPVSGLVKEIEYGDDFTRIIIKSFPMFGDILFSPNNLEVKDVLLKDMEKRHLEILFETREHEEIGISVLPYVKMIKCSCFLSKGDKLLKYTSFLQVDFGGDIYLKIPKTQSIHLKKGHLLWARKTVISGRQEQGQKYENT